MFLINWSDTNLCNLLNWSDTPPCNLINWSEYPTCAPPMHTYCVCTPHTRLPVFDWLSVPTTTNQITGFWKSHSHKILIFFPTTSLKRLRAARIDQLADSNEPAINCGNTNLHTKKQTVEIWATKQSRLNQRIRSLSVIETFPVFKNWSSQNVHPSSIDRHH